MASLTQTQPVVLTVTCLQFVDKIYSAVSISPWVGFYMKYLTF